MIKHTQNLFGIGPSKVFQAFAIFISFAALNADDYTNDQKATILEERVNLLTQELDAMKQILSNQDSEKDNNLVAEADKKNATKNPGEPAKIEPTDCSCCCPPKPTYPKPQFGVHGIIRIDGVVMDRVPLGNIIQPIGAQVPFDFQLERRHYQSVIDARFSRFDVDGTYEVCNTKVKGMIEMDFWTLDGSSLVSNSRHVRLRHAYLRADFPNHWYLLVGQWWGLVTVIDIAWPYPTMCDFIGPAGISQTRQPQVKLGYIRELDNCKGEVECFVGIEQQSVFTTPIGSPNTNIALLPSQGEPSKYPLAAAGIGWKKWEPLQLDLRAGISQNRFAIVNTKRTTEQTSKFVKITAQSKIWDPTFYGSYIYMDGMSRLAFATFFDSVITANLHLKNVKSHGAFVGCLYPIYCDINMNVAFGKYWASEINGTAFSGRNVFKDLKSGQIAFTRKFWGSYYFGVEYKRWNVKNFDNDKGHINLYMTTLAYVF